MRVSRKAVEASLPIIERDIFVRARPSGTCLKKKRSDRNLALYDDDDDASVSSDDSDYTATTGRRWVLTVGLLFLVAAGGVLSLSSRSSLDDVRIGAASDAESRNLREVGPPADDASVVEVDAPVVEGAAEAAFGDDAAIRRSAALFAAAAAEEGLRGNEFVAATAALTPWLDSLGCGLTKMVNVNVVKLRARGAGAAGAPSVEAQVADEVARGATSDDDSVFVASLWNGRVLHFIAELVDGLRGDESARVRTVARKAYDETLAEHHNWLVRPAASAIMALAPDRDVVFAAYAGDADRRRADLAAFSSGLRATLEKLDALFATYEETI